MKKLLNWLSLKTGSALKMGAGSSTPLSLRDYFTPHRVDEQGNLLSEKRVGFMFELGGLDGDFLGPDQMEMLHQQWRSALRFEPGEEVQIIFRKRVEFTEWVESQLSQAFLAENAAGRKILLDHLADQLNQMSESEPRLLSQKIIVCFWTREPLEGFDLEQKRELVESQFSAFGLRVSPLHREQVEKELSMSAQDLSTSARDEAEFPELKLHAGHLEINKDVFRALELVQLPETHTELGMIQALSRLPYPMDLSLRLIARDIKPIVSRLERKRNLLNSQRANKTSPSATLSTQIEQIDQILRDIAEKSESIFDLKLTLGLRFPSQWGSFHRKALATMARAASQMDLCELEESTLGVFDSYLECLPGFSGRNIKAHTVLGSNALHFLPFFRPSKGDQRAVASFQTRSASLYGIDPVDGRLANYNWLVSGTSGSGKSFFVNSLLAQSMSLDPNIFIVDIGGSYNRLTQFLGGRVMSLAPGQGFEMSPFFLPPHSDPVEEKMRRHHIYQIFLEMTRVDGQLPPIEVRHLLQETLEELMDQPSLPQRPITHLIEKLSKQNSPEARRLKILLEPWGKKSFFAQFVDNAKTPTIDEKIFTYDLKGLTEFEDLSRVVQLIVSASLWARIRQVGNQRFSWIVLDEVAFSLLKTQPQFVDELVSTLRKHYAGAVIVVQDLEKVTSSLAGSSILQNTQSKAILQQRGNPKNYAEVLALDSIDQWAIQSLRRKKGSYSDIFLIRDDDKTVIRHVPSDLEYWLSTTAPEDNLVLSQWMKEQGAGDHNITHFLDWRREASR